MADLTITELRDMSAADRAAHAAAQGNRWVYDAMPETGRVERDALVSRLRGWMDPGQIDGALERLRLAGLIGGSYGKGGSVWRATKDGGTDGT